MSAPLFKITKGSAASNMKFWLPPSQPHALPPCLLNLPFIGTRVERRRTRAELAGNDPTQADRSDSVMGGREKERGLGNLFLPR
jgi:hypothetical protein